ncbi:TetR/AcrR family transcriptional regulator [Streptomyces sp. NPDC008313]|uniref:TetR/AcrR family transcriptional regulator n=1 Tax=Streptomyces sp. NPDC008313 TaxID=3364826 RepID=UPI0036E4D9DF
MSKRQYHHGELRNALLDAAEALVREHGVVGWSLREASARVGVSPSAAYHHFASRDALVNALSARVLARLGERMSSAAAQAAGPGVDAQQGMVAAGCAYVRWALEAPAVARLAFGFGTQHAEVVIAPHPHDVIEAELDRLVTTGALNATARPGADFTIWAAMHGLATLLADGLMTLDGPEAADQQTQRLLRAVLTGLTQETAPPQHRPTAHSAHTERRTRRQDNSTTDEPSVTAPTRPQ